MSYAEYREDKLFPLVHAAKKGITRGPISLQVGTTHICVNRCVMCQHWTRPQVKRAATVYLNKDLFYKNVLDPFHDMSGDTICYSGGEAMEHPDMIEVVRQTLKRHVGVGLITSGAGKAFEGDISVLKDCEWIRVSLDAVELAPYMESRGPGFHEVMDNLQRLIRLQAPLGFGITVHKKNVGHVQKVIDWIHRNVPMEIIRGGIRLWLVRGESSLEPSVEDRLKLLSDLRDIPIWKDVPDHNMPDFAKMCHGESELPKGILAVRCGVPLVHLYIDASLRGFPCCIYAGDAEAKPVVDPEWDLSKQTLHEVWSDIVFKEASKFDHGTNKKACQGCTLRLATINQMLDRVNTPRIFV